MKINQTTSSNILAITNASIFIPKTNTFNTLNLALKNNILIGKGYIPDDQNITEINAKNHIIIPQPINLIETIMSKHSYAHITYFQPSELSEKIHTNTLTLFTSHCICHVSFTEFLYCLQEQNKCSTATHFHFLISNPTDSILKHLSTITYPSHFSVGLIFDEDTNLNIPLLKEHLNNNKITTFSGKNICLISLCCTFFKNDCFKYINTLFEQNIKTILNIKQSLFLGEKPSLSIIKKESPFNILCKLKEGVLYYDKNN